MTNEVFIDGDADAIQLRVQGHTTQTNPLQTWEDSAANVLGQIDENGQLLLDGHQDGTPLRVQGHSTQSDPLQTWEDSTGEVLVQVAGDGRLQLGKLSINAPDALIEANNEVSPSGLLRGLQSLGKVTGTISDAIAWAVYELELLGSGSVSGLHTALRSKLTNKNSVDADQAELRAGDFEAINEGGTYSKPVGTMTGVQSAVTNELGAYLEKAIGVNVRIADEGTLEDAYGLKIEDVDQGTGENFAIHTGKGQVFVGDHVALAALTNPPSTNPTSGALIYSKNSDNKLYARTPAGEYVIGSGGSGGARQQIIRNNDQMYATSSTSFVSIDSTNLKCTLNTNGGDVLVWFTGSFAHTNDGRAGLDIRVDGSGRVGASYEYGLLSARFTTSQAVTLGPILITGLSAGTHTFEVMWRTSAATLRLYSDTDDATDYRNVPVLLLAMEVG